MNRLIITFLLGCVIATTFGRLTFSLDPKSETFPLSATAVINNFPLGVHGDLLVHSGFTFPNTLLVRRRDPQGFYQSVGNNSANPFPSFNPLTNGKYVAAHTEGFVTWRLEDTFMVNATYLQLLAFSAKLFDDDSLVTVDNNGALLTFKLIGGNWTIVLTTPVPDNSPIPFAFPPKVNLGTPFIGNYFMAFNHSNGNGTVRVLERQADLSWNVIETVQWTNSSKTAVSAYNGDDTIVVAYSVQGAPTGSDHLAVFTKVNGQWQQQNFQGADLAIDPLGSIGTSVAFSDKDTLFLSAPTDGQSMSSSGFGKIYILTRNSSGLWEPSAELHAKENVSFGLGVNLVDGYLVTVGCNRNNAECIIYSVPQCDVKPIDVTCNDQQRASCSDVDLDSLYTINSCQSANITVVHETTNTNQQASVKFTFYKGDYNATCTSVVSCNLPPSATSSASFIAVSFLLCSALALFF